ncbi:hypothetical protein BB561_002165, partial [Smittium simulii]
FEEEFQISEFIDIEDKKIALTYMDLIMHVATAKKVGRWILAKNTKINLENKLWSNLKKAGNSPNLQDKYLENSKIAQRELKKALEQIRVLVLVLNENNFKHHLKSNKDNIISEIALKLPNYNNFFDNSATYSSHIKK